MAKENEVIASWTLWINNLITDEIFFNILRKLKGDKPSIISNNNDIITPKQLAYIKKLQNEEKIPQELKVDNFSKLEAQMLIQQAILVKPIVETIPKEAIHIVPEIPKDLEEFYAEEGEW
jgi:hypothetical protein